MDRHFNHMWKPFHDSICSLRGNGWTHKDSLSPPLYVEVATPVIGIDYDNVSEIFFIVHFNANIRALRVWYETTLVYKYSYLNDINSFTVKSYDLFMKPLIWYIIDKRTLNVDCRYVYKGNNKITELRTILQRESQNS